MMAPFLTRQAVVEATVLALTSRSVKESMMASYKPTISTDVLGQKIHKLTIIRAEPYTHGLHVWCVCECGNPWDGQYSMVTCGHQKSCGCMRSKGRSLAATDYTGLRFNQLTVVRMTDRKRLRYAYCQCSCGNFHTVRVGHLKSGAIQSCGCLQKDKPNRPRKDYTGQRFGKLVVLSMQWKQSRAYARCLCDCGNSSTCYMGSLRRQATTSCGCLTKSTPERRRAVVRANNHRRRARVKQLPDTLTVESLEFMFRYWDFACCICGRQEGFLWTLALDHFIPVSSSICPGTVPENILPLCHEKKGSKGVGASPCCNTSKGDKDPEEWLTAKLGPQKAKRKLAEINAYFGAASAFAEGLHMDADALKSEVMV